MSHVAGSDRRLHAFLIDRLVVWGVDAAAAYAAYVLLIEPGRMWAGVAAVAGTVLLVSVVVALAVGLRGVTPGKALLGLRVLSVEDAGPIGVGRASVRTAVLGLATLPTGGFGVAALAWTALVDPSGRRRGWHDLRAGSVVVDVRPAPVVEEPVDEAPRQVVNLTALRLVPPSPTPPVPAEAPRDAEPRRPTVPAARWEVEFDTGEHVEVDGLTLVGRRPQARDGEPATRLVALPSDDMSLSKTHVQFQVVPDGALVVLDRGSTNGSLLIRAGVTKRLSAGRPATLRDGDRVRFGDREMTVSRSDHVPPVEGARQRRLETW